MDHDANSSQDEDRTDQEDQEEDQNDDDDQEDGEHGEEESEWECFEEETLIVTLDLGPDGNNILSNSLDYSITVSDWFMSIYVKSQKMIVSSWREVARETEGSRASKRGNSRFSEHSSSRSIRSVS